MGSRREIDTEAVSPAVTDAGMVRPADIEAETDAGRRPALVEGHVPGMTNELMMLRAKSIEREVYWNERCSR